MKRDPPRGDDAAGPVFHADIGVPRTLLSGNTPNGPVPPWRIGVVRRAACLHEHEERGRRMTPGAMSII
jgi:hypothetical protein